MFCSSAIGIGVYLHYLFVFISMVLEVKLGMLGWQILYPRAHPQSFSFVGGSLFVYLFFEVGSYL